MENGREVLTRDHLKNDIEDGKHGRVSLKLAPFNNHNEKDREHQPPKIMRQLCPQLLLHKVPLGSFLARATKSTFQPPHSTSHFSYCIVARVVRINAQATLFVDIGVADGDGDGEGRYVHHDYVENLQTYPHRGNGNDVKPTRADRYCLEEAINEFYARWKSRDLFIPDLSLTSS
jgi:hypothetical protein